MTGFRLDTARQALGPLLHGLEITVALTLLVIVVSLIAGIPVALLRRSRFSVVRWPVGAYVELMRSTPLLIQLVYIYFALPFVGIRLGVFVAGFVGLALNYTAYLSEVYRSGIDAIPPGQTQAGAALGMRSWNIARLIVLPQAIRVVIPTLGNYFVGLFKDTSLVSVIGIQELLFSGQIVAARTYDYFTVYTMVFGFYFVVGFPAIMLVRALERRARSSSDPRRRRTFSDVWRAGARRLAREP